MKKLFALCILFCICTTQKMFTCKSGNENKPQDIFATKQNLQEALWDDDINRIKEIFAVEKYWHKHKNLPTPFRSSLLQAPFDTQHPHDPPVSPLEIAAQAMNPEIVYLLVKYGADVNYSQSILDAPLTHICDNDTYKHKNSHEILDILIQAKINTNQQDGYGETPLHHLASSLPSKNHDILQPRLLAVRKLLSAGANPYLRSRYGWTVFDTAKYVARTESCDVFINFLNNETCQQPNLVHLKEEALAQYSKANHRKVVGPIYRKTQNKSKKYK